MTAGTSSCEAAWALIFRESTLEILKTGSPENPSCPSVPFSRVEAAALGLKFPVYNEDMVPLVLAQNRPPQPTNRYNPNSDSPYALNYTLGIQRALTRSLVLETAYVGTRGIKFYMYRTFNKVD